MGASSDTDQRVIAILAAQALHDPAGLTRRTSIESLGIDSMGLAEILFAIEEEFDIAVPFNANNPSESDFDISTVASIIAGVKRLKAEQG